MNNINWNDMHNGILFSHNKDENPDICNDMDGPGGTILNDRTRCRKMYIVWSHLYVELKKLKLIEAESR